MVSACALAEQGFEPCGNLVSVNGGRKPPCAAGLKREDGTCYRLIYDYMLSRPEDYLSIYQSGCNHRCLKCHSWYFSQVARGTWMSPKDVLNACLEYAEQITVWEPRDRTTSWHATDLCLHCGSCLLGGRHKHCPRKLRPDQVVLSPQGFGPARNIVSFTGGDLFCRPEFYCEVFKLVKRELPDVWTHIETNGYGLTPRNLEELVSAGLDSVWLDMKAYDGEVYRRLCGTGNEHILELPARIKDAGLVLEVVLLFIPGWVEFDQLRSFAELIASVDPDTPVTLLAFFPEFELRDVRKPTLSEMVTAFSVMKGAGLRRVKLANLNVFCESEADYDLLVSLVGRNAI